MMIASRGKHVRRYGVRATSRRFLRLGMVGKALSFALSFLIATQPLLVQAQQIQNDSQANRANQPRVGVSANGVSLIDIVTPNAAGLSHNKYSDFNVGTSGVILNNSNQTVSRSLLGGLVQGNANLHHFGPASLILNETAKDNASSADQENTQNKTNSTTGNPQPDDDDENNRDNNRPSLQGNKNI